MKKSLVKYKKLGFEEIEKWVDKIKQVKQHEKDAKVGIVAEANKTYGAFGPGTVNLFMQCLSYHIFH
ncbi:MAG: hypothetical protein E6L03_07625 [Thaumarchaeota archaeon]|nr:MAG: hypothetical protein E6L03_07625 [Nitrososphaerota archaeon]